MSVLLYVLIGTTFRNVYNMCLRGPILGPVWSPKEVKILIFGYWFHISIASHAHCKYFKRCVESEAQIFLPFWASKWIKINFFFKYFVKKFPLDSYQSCFICSLELLSQMCIIWAFDFGPLWAQKVSENSGLWSFSQKVFTGFTSVLLYMLIASTFRCVENMGLRGPILGPHWAQNNSKFRSLVIF